MRPASDDARRDRVYEFGPFRLHSQRQMLESASGAVPLTAKVFELLLYLLQERGRLVSKEELLAHVWPDAVVEEGNLARHISTLRKILGDNRESHRYIVTVSGQGYRFVADVREMAPAEGSSYATDEARRDGGAGAAHNAPPAGTAALSVSRQPLIDAAAAPAGGSDQPSGRDRSRLLAVTALIVLGVSVAAIGAAWVARKPTMAIGTPRVIAVLPFKPLATSARDEAFEIGMTGSVITRLSRIPDLTVIPLGSVRRFAALDQDPVEAGRALGAGAVFEGHVHRTADGVRVQARLLRSSDGSALWAMEWDEQPAGALALEARISESLAEALQLELAPAERESIRRQETVSLEAQERYFFGKYHLGVREGARARQAEEAFRAAIRLDPHYARAHAGLAHALSAVTWLDRRPARETQPESKAAALEALRLDPSLADAYAALGNVQHRFEFDHVAADRSFQRAFALDDADWVVLFIYTSFLMDMNRVDEALSINDRHLQLEPSSWLAHRVRAMVLYVGRRYEECEIQSRKALEIDPRSGTAYGWLAACLEAQGRYDEVVDVLEEYRSKAGGSLDDQRRAARMRALYRAKGWKAYWAEERAGRTQLYGGAGHQGTAKIDVRLGDIDAALTTLERTLDERHPSLPWLNQSFWDPLRSHPRFQAILHRVGVPESAPDLAPRVQ